VLAVPVLFEGPMRVWGWIALAIAFAALAVFAKRPLVAIASVVTWLLAIGGIIQWASLDEAAWRVVLPEPTPVPSVFLLAIGVAIIGHILAAMFWRSAGINSAADSPDPWSSVTFTRSPLPASGGLLHVIAALVWIFASITCLQILAATVSLLGYALLTAAASFSRLNRQLAYLSAVAVLTAAIKWVGVDELSDRLAAATASATRPFFNEHLAVGVMIAITMALIGWLRREVLIPSTRQSTALDLFRSALVLAVAIVLTIGLSIEIEQAVSAADAAGTLPWPRSQALLLDFTIL
jgi:hypothetical protein